MFPLNLYARVRFLMPSLHTRPRVQRAPGLPCALRFQSGVFPANLARIARRDREVTPGRHRPPPGLAHGEPDDRLQRASQYFRRHQRWTTLAPPRMSLRSSGLRRPVPVPHRFHPQPQPLHPIALLWSNPAGVWHGGRGIVDVNSVRRAAADGIGLTTERPCHSRLPVEKPIRTTPFR